MKSKTELMKALRERLKKAGLVRSEVWTTKENKPAVMALDERKRIATNNGIDVNNQTTIWLWKLETAKRYREQISRDASSIESLKFANACYENISGDIENESPQNCVDNEIDAMQADL